MRKFLALAVFALLLPTAALAAGGSATKVGVFDPDVVIRTSVPGKAAIQAFDTKMKPERDRIEAQRKAFIKARDAFQKQAFALAPQARQDKERELRRKEFELSEAIRMFQNEVNREKSLKLNEIVGVLDTAVHNYAVKNGYTLVIAKVQGITYYVAPGSDITGAITTELNRAWKTRPKK